MKKWCLVILLLPLSCYSQIITTIAGGGSTIGDGGPATAARINNPTGIAFNKKTGDLYIATGAGHRVRKIDTFGIITTVAGTGIAGYSGDNSQATAAQINFASDVTIDTSGNIYISQHFNPAIRKIDATTGIITTICGNGISAYAGENVPATAAQLYAPAGICLDKFGNIYIADDNIHRVRKINTAGIITTFAGTGVYGYNGDGIPATDAQLYFPESITTDDTGNIYISDQGNARIRKVNTAGIISTYAGNGTATYIGDGMPATNAQFSPWFISFDEDKNLFIAAAPSRVFEVDNSGIFHIIAGTGVAINSGDGGPAIAASLKGPVGVALNECNNLYISNTSSSADSDKIRKISFHPDCINTTDTPSHVGVVNVNGSRAISVYPNPVWNELHVDGGYAGNYAITNITGYAVLQGAIVAGKNTIHMGQLPAGIYFVAVTGEDGERRVWKVVKE